MDITAKAAAEELKCQDRILILSHQNPDGDTLGCAFALCRALSSMGKLVRVECPDSLPQRFSYLYADCVQPDFEPEYIVAVDIAALQLMGNLREVYGDRVDLCIDHHPSNEKYAAKTCLCSAAAAACELVYSILCLLEVTITPTIADCLYTGIATDSGCFKYSNTTADTHRIAADLMEAGANYRWTNEYLFDTKSKSRIAVEQQVLNTMEYFCDDRVAIIGISQEMIERTHADESELDGVSAIPRMIEGVQIGITIREKPDGTHKISIRTTSEVDASSICQRFGGGGHARAAGCLIEADYETAKEQLVSVCREFLSA